MMTLLSWLVVVWIGNWALKQDRHALREERGIRAAKAARGKRLTNPRGEGVGSGFLPRQLREHTRIRVCV
jgi:hypothetical protein